MNRQKVNDIHKYFRECFLDDSPLYCVNVFKDRDGSIVDSVQKTERLTLHEYYLMLLGIRNICNKELNRLDDCL